jgi:hypothetical protein
MDLAAGDYFQTVVYEIEGGALDRKMAKPADF